MRGRPIATLLAVTLLAGCFGRGGGLGLRLFEAAVITAVVVSAVEPPPPREVYVPEPRPGYAWQPGYWTRNGDDWVWVDGGWIEQRPSYQWVPTHWERGGDGNWHLISGQWVPA